MDRIKYPRTYHLPFSGGIQSDDKIIKSLDQFENKEVVISIKMDGENTTIYPDGYTHARSIDSRSNWTRDIVRSSAASFQYMIPVGHRLCLENVYAAHSIKYPDGYLKSYLYLLSIWDGDYCLPYEDTMIYADMFGLVMPRVIYEGPFDLDLIKKLPQTLDTTLEEGFVIRIKDGFHYDDFSKYVTKWVRPNHVQTDVHWLKTATKNGCLATNP